MRFCFNALQLRRFKARLPESELLLDLVIDAAGQGEIGRAGNECENVKESTQT